MSYDKLDVAQGSLGPGQAGFHGVDLSVVGAPVGVPWRGRAGEDDTDA
jgi:hypothetical protein